MGIGLTRPDRRAGSCHKAPSGASIRRVWKAMKWGGPAVKNR